MTYKSAMAALKSNTMTRYLVSMTECHTTGESLFYREVAVGQKKHRLEVCFFGTGWVLDFFGL